MVLWGRLGHVNEMTFHPQHCNIQFFFLVRDKSDTFHASVSMYNLMVKFIGQIYPFITHYDGHRFHLFVTIFFCHEQFRKQMIRKKLHK